MFVYCYECAKGATLHSNSLLLCLFGFIVLEIRIEYAYLVVSEFQCEWLADCDTDTPNVFFLAFIYLLINLYITDCVLCCDGGFLALHVKFRIDHEWIQVALNL